MKDFRPISSLIKDQIIDSDDPPVDNAIQSDLKQRWLCCAGRAAMWSHPLLFSSGRLVVFTQSAIWATELRHHMPEIQSALEEFDISTVDIRTSPGNFPAPRKQLNQITLSDNNRKGMALTARRIEHQGVQEALIRLSRKRKR